MYSEDICQAHNVLGSEDIWRPHDEFRRSATLGVESEAGTPEPMGQGGAIAPLAFSSRGARGAKVPFSKNITLTKSKYLKKR